MRSLRAPTLAALLASGALLTACGDDAKPAPPPSGWIDVPGMICADGTPTGLAISPGSADAVMVFLMAGGACWGEAANECDVITRGPFGRAQYEFLSAFGVTGTIFDRAVPGNPFADWTLVFVPYCTGDVHAGDEETTHGGVLWKHHGRRNLEFALGAVTAALPAPAKLAVTGSSAGGFGSLLAFDLVRQAWPAPGTSAYLVDDSGPTLVGGAIPQATRDAWWTSWNLVETVEPMCSACKDDLSQLWDVVSANHAGDRLAFLSTARDAEMMYFFGKGAVAFEADVRALASKIDALPDANAFVVAGAGHALFFGPAAYSAGGTSLLAWLAQQVGDDAGWSSVGPP